MKICVNDKAVTVDASTLLIALQQLQLDKEKGIAVAVNDSVINRSQWADHPLAEGDNILIVHATQGG